MIQIAIFPENAWAFPTMACIPVSQRRTLDVGQNISLAEVRIKSSFLLYIFFNFLHTFCVLLYEKNSKISFFTYFVTIIA